MALPVGTNYFKTVYVGAVLCLNKWTKMKIPWTVHCTVEDVGIRTFDSTNDV